MLLIPSRRAAQTVICEILAGLVRLIAPILVHTADEAWSTCRKSCGRTQCSLQHLTDSGKGILDENAEDKGRVHGYSPEVLKALELARRKIPSVVPDAGVTLYPDAELCQILSQFDTRN